MPIYHADGTHTWTAQDDEDMRLNKLSMEVEQLLQTAAYCAKINSFSYRFAKGLKALGFYLGVASVVLLVIALLAVGLFSGVVTGHGLLILLLILLGAPIVITVPLFGSDA